MKEKFPTGLIYTLVEQVTDPNAIVITLFCTGILAFSQKNKLYSFEHNLASFCFFKVTNLPSKILALNVKSDITESSHYTPQPVSRAVLTVPLAIGMTEASWSMYLSAPCGNWVPPPGNLNTFPSYCTQFCTAFSTVKLL
jgi:hypothetical protein